MIKEYEYEWEKHTCGECTQFGDKRSCLCKHMTAEHKACASFKSPPTLFDQITASPEVLAPNFVYRKWSVLKADFVWHSTILKGKLGNDFNTVEFKTEKQAIAATVAKLKGIEG